MGSPRKRPNLAHRREEHWRPPPLEWPRTRFERLVAVARRFVDLQAGSIWQDVKRNAQTVRGKVVDVGCGAQPYRPLFPPSVEYVGLDTADAKQRFGYEAPDTVYYDGLTWPDAVLDADFLLCTEALEHVLDPRAFLAEAHRCLRPGGRMLLTVPFAARWHFIPFDYWRFTPSCLASLLEDAGFGEIVVLARGNPTTVACYKALGIGLPLLMPQGAPGLGQWSRMAAGAAASPLLALLATIANISMRNANGDDCLGYTVMARRLEAPTTTKAVSTV